MGVASLIQRFDDKVNPIVVKELRQAVAGKYVASVLILFLVVQLFTIGIFLLFSDTTADDFAAGKGVFTALSTILLATCLLFVPIYAALRLSAERSDTQVDLLYVTTIRPRSIIWGKFLSAMVITTMIYSACLPFISLTFLLRGIDLPTIFLLLGIDYLVIAACTMFMIFLACIPANRMVRSMLALIGLGTLISVFFMNFALVGNVMLWGMGISYSDPEFWIGLAATVSVLASVIGLLFVISVAMVSPPSSNRALIVRTYLTGVWLAFGVACFVWSGMIRDHLPIIFWFVTTMLAGCVAILIVVSERDHYGARLRGMIPKNFVLRRLAFVFYSGAAGGVAWTVGLLAVTVFIAWWWADHGYRNQHELYYSLESFTPLAMYFLAYALTALMIRRKLLSRLISPSNTYALALILMAIGTIVPFALSLMLVDRPWYRLQSDWYVTVPFMVFEDRLNTTAWWFVGIWTGLIVALSLPWFFKRSAAFQPIERADEPAEPQPAEARSTVS